jgi:hypothetical protein
MNDPVLQIFWLHRRLFLGIMCLTFLALAIGIFVLPRPRAIVRTSIEIGVINETLQPLEPPEQVARRIPGVYAPAIILAMARKGTPPSILGALQNSTVENIGRSLIVLTAIDASAEKEAKEFQEAITDQIIKEEAPRAQMLRDEIAERIALTKKAADKLDRQTDFVATELERIRTLSDNLQGQIENQEATVAALRQRAETTQQPTDRSAIEDEIRKFQGQISNQVTLMGSLTLERSRLMRNLAMTNQAEEAQIRLLADAQLEQKLFAETRVSLAPSLMPVTASYRRTNLLFVAIAISILVAFGTVVLVHNFVEQKIER